MASEDYSNSKRSRPHKPYNSSHPPPPPPPPPPFPVHGYHRAAERRSTAAKSFKEELQDHSMRGRGDRFLQSSHSFNSPSHSSGGGGNSSPAKPRSSFDGSSSSYYSSPAKLVRTIRPRGAVQVQSQEQPDDAAGDVLDSHGSDEPYGYRAYQSIPRFQYERVSSDPILGKVAVSSDETESSDDDDGDVSGGGNSSPVKPRSSFDGSSSSYYSSPAKSVRTIRPRGAVQVQSQEQPDDAAGDVLDSHGSDEPYGYRAYQSIPRLQYERVSSDPILGKVAVSSDETESSDDDDGDVGGGGYSTRTRNSPRESTPEVDENEVDKKAEEFIARFREQMRLERIESIKKPAGPRDVKHGK